MAMFRMPMLHTASKDLMLTGPPRGEFHVWVVNLQTEVDVSVLSPAEVQRSARLLAPALRRRSVASRAVLRSLCGAYTGTAPREIRFSYGQHGKPALDSAVSLHFNVAHTGDLAVLAFTADGAVGIDVEEIRPMMGLERVLEDFCSADDRRWVLGGGEDGKLERFFCCWTRMEARAKLTGDGLQRAWGRTVPGSGYSPSGGNVEFAPTNTSIASIAYQGRPPVLSFMKFEDVQSGSFS